MKTKPRSGRKVRSLGYNFGAGAREATENAPDKASKAKEREKNLRAKKRLR